MATPIDIFAVLWNSGNGFYVFVLLLGYSALGILLYSLIRAIFMVGRKKKPEEHIANQFEKILEEQPWKSVKIYISDKESEDDDCNKPN